MNDSAPLFSVLMCTYNHEQYIEAAIRGVLSQQCDFAFELLIGDDCSTDNTPEIINKYIRKHPGIVRLIKPNHNLGASHNFVNLVRNARGVFISVCDGDDFWHNAHLLQRQHETYSSDSGIGMVCAKARCLRQMTNKYLGSIGYEGAENLEQMLRDNRDVAAPTISFNKKMFEKCICESAWYIEKNYFYDTVFAYWFAYNSKIKFINEELATYRVLENSACHSSDMSMSYKYEKRYLSVKWHFIMEHPLKSELMFELLMSDFDKFEKLSSWRREKEIRCSKPYALGVSLLRPLKSIIRLVGNKY